MQFAAGAKVGDPDAVIWLQRAFREEMQRSVAVAVDLLLSVINLTGEATEAWFRLVVEALDPLTWAGRPEEAEALARRALAYDPVPTTRFGLLMGLANALSPQVMRFGDAVTYTVPPATSSESPTSTERLLRPRSRFLNVAPGNNLDVDWTVALADAAFGR